MEDESKEWMTVSYDENVIEYDEYGDYQDDAKVEIDEEVHSEIFVEYIENAECDKTQYEHTDHHCYHLGEEVYSTPPDIEHNSLTKYEPEVEASATSQQNLENSSEEEQQQQLNRNLRSIRLKCLIQRENNRLKKKLLNCRICGTNSRFLNVEIRKLQAEKQKLLEETGILRLAKEKLLNQVTLIKSNLLVE